jgi:hypothetical protein
MATMRLNLMHMYQWRTRQLAHNGALAVECQRVTEWVAAQQYTPAHVKSPSATPHQVSNGRQRMKECTAGC